MDLVFKLVLLTWFDLLLIDCVHTRCNRYHKTERQPGEVYEENCLRCVCSESQKKVKTCYRAANGKFKRYPYNFLYWAQYYIDITEQEAVGFKCPIGLEEAGGNKEYYAEFYIHYIRVKRILTCCEKNPAPRRISPFCKAKKDENCENKIVLRSNSNMECPFKLTKRKEKM